MLGRVRTSTTFPSLCSAKVQEDVVVGIAGSIELNTVDYHGNQVMGMNLKFIIYSYSF